MGWESDELRIGLDRKKIMEGFVQHREKFGLNWWAMGDQYIFYKLEKQYFFFSLLFKITLAAVWRMDGKETQMEAEKNRGML